MKVKFFLMAAAAMTLATSCSNDEVVLENNAGNAIAFTAVSENASRAATAYCNNALPTDFQVWANVPNGEGVKTYFSDVKYTKADGATTWTCDINDLRYWPSTGSINFFATKDAIGTPSFFSTLVYADCEQTTVVADQKDFIYAVAAGATKPEDNKSTQALNFRHALSQVVFKAKNTNAHLHVSITGVTVKQVNSKGNFILPEQSTVANIVDHTQNSFAPVAAEGFGTWEGQSTLADYGVTFTETPILLDPTTLTASQDNVAQANAMLLIPQSTTALDPSNREAWANKTGSYFLVYANIWNVAGDQFNADTDVLLRSAEQPIAIPFAAKWLQGKKYTYTFVFGKGNGGYDPITGDDVLVPIDFEITVDDFVKAINSDTNVPMDEM